MTLEENLFQPLMPTVRQSFEQGDGKELGKPGTKIPGKMQALHSSSALGVNVFQYWKALDELAVIAHACAFIQPGAMAPEALEFEAKFPIHKDFALPPNLDVVMRYPSGGPMSALAIECKFSEAYGRRDHGGVKPAYLKLVDVWKGLPALRALAVAISPEDHRFRYLHAAQLVKHVLGLQVEFGPRHFRLLYLWYDVPGPEGAIHRAEVQDFASVARADGVAFHALSYQELICGMASRLAPQHEDYIAYLVQRYV